MNFRHHFIVFASLCLQWAAFGAVYTVSDSRELLDKLSIVQPGDTILVEPGVYIDDTDNTSKYAFNPSRSGTAQNPIVIKSAQLHQAVFKGSTNGSPALGIYGRDHIVLDGFRVEGAIGFRSGADYGIVRNCDVSEGYIQGDDTSLHWGIFIQSSQHCLIENNYVHDMGSFGNGSHNGACIMAFDAQNSIIQNNTADGGGHMYSAYGQKSGPVRDNTWRRNIARNAKVAFLGMGSTDGTRYSQRNVYYENIAVNTQLFMELDHNCTDWKVYNNTAHGIHHFIYGGYTAAEKNNSGMEAWNNIGSTYMYVQNRSTPSSWNDLIAFSEGNIMQGDACSWHYDRQRMTLSQWQEETGLDTKSFVYEPEYVDPDGGDFHLAQGSPLVHGGIVRGTLSPGYDNQAPDIGAYPRGNDSTLIGHDWNLGEIGDVHPRLGRRKNETSNLATVNMSGIVEAGVVTGYIQKNNVLNLTLPSGHGYTAARLFDMRGRTIARWSLEQFGAGGNLHLPVDSKANVGSMPLLCELKGIGRQQVINLHSVR